MGDFIGMNRKCLWCAIAICAIKFAHAGSELEKCNEEVQCDMSDYCVVGVTGRSNQVSAREVQGVAVQ